MGRHSDQLHLAAGAGIFSRPSRPESSASNNVSLAQSGFGSLSIHMCLDITSASDIRGWRQHSMRGNISITEPVCRQPYFARCRHVHLFSELQIDPLINACLLELRYGSMPIHAMREV